MGRHQAIWSASISQVEAACLTLEMAQLPVTAFSLEVLDAFLDACLAPREHGVDQTSQLVGRRLNRTRRNQPSPARPVTGGDDLAPP